MDGRRSLFRLWAVFSLIWVILVAVISAVPVKDEFEKAATMKTLKGGGYKPDLPLDCTLARGAAGTDYVRDGPLCWYDMNGFRHFYPEYKDLDDDALSEGMYGKAGISLSKIKPWSLLAKRLSLTLLPLASLVLALTTMRALRGVRRSRPSS